MAEAVKRGLNIYPKFESSRVPFVPNRGISLKRSKRVRCANAVNPGRVGFSVSYWLGDGYASSTSTKSTKTASALPIDH